MKNITYVRQLITKKFISQTLKFAVVGVLNTIIGYGIYYLLLKLNLYYIFALLIAHILGAVNSYLWNKYWTFASKKKSFVELLRFISVYIVTFISNLALLAIFVEKLMIDKAIGGFLSLMIVTILSFFGHKLWTFSKINIRYGCFNKNK